MGSKPAKQVSQLTPGQEQLLQQLTGQVQQVLPQGIEAIMGQLDPASAQEQFRVGVADPAMERFRSEVIPSILQATRNLGAKGGAAQDRQLGRAARGLESDLAAQQALLSSQQQQQALQSLAQLLGVGVGTQAVAIQPPQPGFGQQLLGLGGTLGAAALGRPVGR